jgi:phosphoenolpyruvate synthase/pyruvate phosphate dikinase
MTYTAWFEEIRKDDIALVGGKGANLALKGPMSDLKVARRLCRC